jgi:hypothetical protein
MRVYAYVDILANYVAAAYRSGEIGRRHRQIVTHRRASILASIGVAREWQPSRKVGILDSSADATRSIEKGMRDRKPYHRSTWTIARPRYSKKSSRRLLVASAVFARLNEFIWHYSAAMISRRAACRRVASFRRVICRRRESTPPVAGRAWRDYAQHTRYRTKLATPTRQTIRCQ